MLSALAWAALFVATIWTLAGLVAVARATRRTPVLSPNPPAVSVLKPLCGADAELERNLESFFRQDQPEFELIFGLVDANDPALAVVERVRARYPHVPCQVVVHAGAGALNPKVNNLVGLLPRAAHDLVLVSDSNVRAPRHYVRELASLYEREGSGLITNLFAGARENSCGSALESVELAGFVAAGVALPTLLGDPLLVGKSALFSRQRLHSLGGLERLSDVLAEDFVLGKTFAHAGERLIIAPTVLQNVNRGLSLRAALARKLRWSMLRFRLRPTPAALEPLTNPLALLPLAWLVLGPWALVWAASIALLRDAGGWWLLRGPKRLWLPVLCALPRDFCALVIWAIAPLKHHVSWRGSRYRLGAGTLLYVEPARRARTDTLASFVG
ncbi:MAG TPA: glycosyltransferase [Polyangiaceae bacterium]|nr:glycosyltransferase [Polyangiaceae bacterium]